MTKYSQKLTDLEPGDGECFQFLSIVKDSQVGFPLPLALYLTENPALRPCHVLPWPVNNVEAETLGFEEIRGTLGGCGGKQVHV